MRIWQAGKNRQAEWIDLSKIEVPIIKADKRCELMFKGFNLGQPKAIICQGKILAKYEWR